MDAAIDSLGADKKKIAGRTMKKGSKKTTKDNANVLAH